MQKLSLWFTFVLIVLFASPSIAEELIGKWRGKLQMTPQAALTIGINISKETGGYTLTIDSPNQGMFDYNLSQFKLRKQTEYYCKVRDLKNDISLKTEQITSYSLH